MIIFWLLTLFGTITCWCVCGPWTKIEGWICGGEGIVVIGIIGDVFWFTNSTEWGLTCENGGMGIGAS